MKQFCAMIGKFFGVIAIVFLILGMVMPENFLWVLGKVGDIGVLSCLFRCRYVRYGYNLKS